jgi:NitT/TauT family transport system ATP-binding protein
MGKLAFGGEMIKVINLSKTFDGKKVLDGIDLEIQDSSITCILGPTGCGKTTFLRLVAGLVKPDAGMIEAERENISYIFQQKALYPWRDVVSNVCLPLELRNVSKKERISKAQMRLDEVGLGKELHSRIYHLSGGMQQRVQLARALVSEPMILLADEPFGQLDERTKHELQLQLRQLCTKREICTVLVTHDIDEAVYLADRIILLGKGKAVFDKKINEDHPRDRLSTWFFDQIKEIRMVFESLI